MVTRGENGKALHEKARQIRLVLTDCDGVLTDGSVYYSHRGEEMKRFSIRDGMGVERLRKLADVDVGIITGETSPSLQRRAEKLGITELHLGARDKMAVLGQILERRHVTLDQVAYIGDDTNDAAVMQRVGLSACPADAMRFAKDVADYVCDSGGGHGAFRDFAELIIAARGI
jgi:3-deoxy-D-manno-octulosonate 8-phosphate phosphatase (KDO 8-P phosphatase)